MFNTISAKITVLTGLLLALFAGCTAPGSNTTAGNTEADRPVSGGTLTYRITSPPKSFNYLLAEDEPTIIAAFFLTGSRLVEFDHKTQEFAPALAESFSAADDGRTMNVKLRQGLKFSDGQPLTTKDVAFSLDAVYDERTNSPAFRDSMLVNGKLIEARIVDDLQIQLVFPETVASAENYLDNLVILPEHVLGAEQKAGRLAEAWKINSDPAAIVSSGPFTPESAAAGERFVFRRNPHFWRKDAAGTPLPYLDKIVLEVVPDANNAIARLQQGAIDIVDRIRPGDYASLRSGTGGVRAYDIGPGLAVDHIWFNLNTAGPDGQPLNNEAKFRWFSEKRFRQAVSMAVDRKTIASTTLQGLATPLYGFVSPANKIWSDPQLPETKYDLERAAALLAEAGFRKVGTPDAPELTDAEGNRVEFTLIVPTENEPRKLMAAVIQEDLAKLGIRMQIAPIDFQALTKRWSASYDYDAVLLGLAVSGIDPNSYANFLLSSAAVHQWRPSQKMPVTDWEARVDELFQQQSAETDPQRRAEIFRQLQQVIAEETPVIPIVARHIVSAAQERVGNYSPSPVLPHSLWNVADLYVKQ